MVNPAVQYPRRRLQTGVFPVMRFAHATPEQLASSVRTLVEPALAAALVMPTPATQAYSAVVSSSGAELNLTSPLVNWVGSVRQTTLLEVPVALRRPLMCFRALCVPIATPVLHLGAVLVPAAQQLDQLVSAVEDAACDFALRLELLQRDQFLAALAANEEGSDEGPISSAPAFQALLAEEFVPVSRRSA